MASRDDIKKKLYERTGKTESAEQSSSAAGGAKIVSQVDSIKATLAKRMNDRAEEYRKVREHNAKAAALNTAMDMVGGAEKTPTPAAYTPMQKRAATVLKMGENAEHTTSLSPLVVGENTKVTGIDTTTKNTPLGKKVSSEFEKAAPKITREELETEALNAPNIENPGFVSRDKAEFIPVAEAFGDTGKRNVKDMSFNLDNRTDDVDLINFPTHAMTDTEKYTYSYYLDTDPDKAKQYIDLISADVNARHTEKMGKTLSEMSKEHPFAGATLGTMLSTADTLSLVPQAVAALTGQEYDPNSALNVFGNMSDALTEGALSNIENPILQTAAGAGISVGQNLLQTAMSGGSATLTRLTMASNAAAGTGRSAAKLGASTEQAAILTVVAGVAEYFFEKVPVEKMLGSLSGDAVKEAIKDASKRILPAVLKDIGSNIATESIEELLTETVNNIANFAVLGDKSAYAQLRDEMIDSGKGVSEAARDAAVQYFVVNPLLAGLGGAIAGGATATAGAIINTPTYARIGMEHRAARAAEAEAKANAKTEKTGAQTGEPDTTDIPRDSATDSNYDKIPIVPGSKAEIEAQEKAKAENTQTSEDIEQSAGTLDIFEDTEGILTDEELEEMHKYLTEDAANATEVTEGDIRLTTAHDQLSETGHIVLPTAEQEQRRALAEKEKTDTAKSGVLEGVSRKDIRTAELLSKVFGRKVLFISDSYRVNGKVENGIIYVNAKKGYIVSQILAHEFTHTAEGAKQYGQLMSAVKKLYASDGKVWDNLVDDMLNDATYINHYKRQGKKFTKTDAEHELVARAVEKIFGSEAKLTQFAKDNRNIVTRFYAKVRNWIQGFADLRLSEDEYEAVQLIRDIERKLAKALLATKKQSKASGKGVQYMLESEGKGAYTDYDKPITYADVELLHEISREREGGKKDKQVSVNEFTSKDIQRSAKWAYKFLKDKGVGLKSPFFRAWFGDWRAYDINPVQCLTMAKTDGKNPRGTFVNKDTGWAITSSSVGYDETNSHRGKDQKSLIAMRNIDRIIESSILLDTEVSDYGRGKKSIYTSFMHKFYSPILIDGSPYIAKMAVDESYLPGQKETNKKFYHVIAIEIEKVPTVGIGGSHTPIMVNTDSTISIADLFKLVKTYDPDFEPHSVNKAMLNADGTPKVMYHGTNADFTVFDRKKIGSATDDGIYGQGFYFSSHKNQSVQYGNVSEYYLKIKNPLVLTDYSSIEELAEVLDMSESCFSMSGGIIRPRYSFVSQFTSHVTGAGFDGVIVDYGTTDEIVVFDSTQIKSATDNIGTFDGNNPDIRYSLATDAELRKQAIKMLQDGVSAKRVYEETGFFIDNKGRIRNDIDDTDGKDPAIRKPYPVEDTDKIKAEAREKLEAEREQHKKELAYSREYWQEKTRKAKEDVRHEYAERDARRTAQRDAEKAKRKAEKERRKRARGGYISMEKIRKALENNTFVNAMEKLWEDLRKAEKAAEVYATINIEEADPELQEEIKRLRNAVEDRRVYIRKVGQQKRKVMRQKALELLRSGNIEAWADKKALGGARYSINTMLRNIEDISRGDALGKEVYEQYFAPISKHVAQATRLKNDTRARIAELGLSTKVRDGDVLSESAFVQLLGEARDNIYALTHNVGHTNVYNGNKTRNGRTLEDWQNVVDTLMLENPSISRNADAMKRVNEAIDTFKEIYDDLFKSLNKVRIYNGYAPIDYRHGYFPHFSSETAVDSLWAELCDGLNFKLDTEDLPATINGLTSRFRPGMQYQSFDKSRSEHIGEQYNNIRLDGMGAVEGIDRYIEVAANVIYLTEDIQKLRALSEMIRYNASDNSIKERINEIRKNDELSEEEKQSAIESYLGSKPNTTLSNFVWYLEDYTNILAGKKSFWDRAAEQALGRGIYTAAKKIESRIAGNMVAINPGSWLTNFIPLTQAAAVTGNARMILAAKQTVKAAKDDDGFVSRSAFLTNRRGSERLVKTRVRTVSDVLSAPMELIDNFTAETVVRARYNENIANGMSESEAMNEADTFAAGLMGDRSLGSQPTIFSQNNPVTKLFTQYQLEVANQLMFATKDLPRMYGDKEKRKLAAVIVKMALYAFLYNFLYKGLTGRDAAADPLGILNDVAGDAFGIALPDIRDFFDKGFTSELFKTENYGQWKDTKNWQEAAWKTVEVVVKSLGTVTEGTLEQIPFTSALGLVLEDFDQGRLPISSAVPNIPSVANVFTSFAESMQKSAGTDNKSTAYKKLVNGLYNEILVPASYILAPFGVGQAKKITDTADALIKGGSYTYDADGQRKLQYPVFTDEGFLSVGAAVKGFTFGKSSLGTAQEWVDSGFGSLSAKQTAAYEAMVNVGASQREAWDALNAVKTAGSKQIDKVRALLELELSDRAKLILFRDIITTAEKKIAAAEESVKKPGGIDTYLEALIDELEGDNIPEVPKEEPKAAKIPVVPKFETPKVPTVKIPTW